MLGEGCIMRRYRQASKSSESTKVIFKFKNVSPKNFSFVPSVQGLPMHMDSVISNLPHHPPSYIPVLYNPWLYICIMYCMHG